MPSGESYFFASDGPVSEEEIRNVEQKHGVTFPASYREFLRRIGPGQYFMDEYELGSTFHAPEGLEGHSADVFETREDPFPKLLLVVSLAGGEEGGFYLPRTSADNFSIFMPDEEPEEWGIQTETWTGFEQWMIQLVESSGDEIYP